MATKKSIGLKALQNMFLDYYINEKYANKLHYLEYVEIVLYNSCGTDTPKIALVDNFKPYTHINQDDLKGLQPYINKYRNTTKRYTFFNASVHKGKNFNEEMHRFFFIYDKNNNTVSEFTSKEDYNIQHRKLIKTFFEMIYSNNAKIIFEDWDRLVESKYLKYSDCSLFNHDDKNDFFDKNQAYCVIWMLWFLEMILTKPNVTTNQIKLKHREFLHDSQKQICKIAESYAAFVHGIDADYKIIYPKRKIEKSAPLKLIQHPFDPKINWVWHGNSDKSNLFLHFYIEQKYSKKLHLLDYTEIVLYRSHDKNNRTIYKAALADYSKPKTHIHLDSIKELEPYISKYRNTAKRYTLFNANIHSPNSLGHSFFFIYDKKNNVVTRFDSEERYVPHATKSIKRFFKCIYSDDVKVIFGNYESAHGIQVIHNICCRLFGDNKNDVIHKHQEYSMVWMFWFLEMIMINPKLSIHELKLKIELLLFESKELICKIAAGYSQFIDKTTSKYKIVYPKKKTITKNKDLGSYVATKKN